MSDRNVAKNTCVTYRAIEGFYVSVESEIWNLKIALEKASDDSKCNILSKIKKLEDIRKSIHSPMKTCRLDALSSELAKWKTVQ